MGTKTIPEPNKKGVAKFQFGKHDLFWQYKRNPTLRAIIDTGDYIYIDGHLCLKSPDCFKIKGGRVQVRLTTETALGEYCVAKVTPNLNNTAVVVDTSAQRKTDITKRTHRRRFGFLFEKHKGYVALGKPALGYKTRKRRGSSAAIKRIAKTYIHAQKHTTFSDVDRAAFLSFVTGGGDGQPPSGTFGQGVKFYIKREGITQEILAGRMGVATETVSRICRDVYEPPLNMAVAICIGLHLLPYESRKLLLRLGYTLDGDTPTIRTYQSLIDVFYLEEVCDCNTFLIENGLKPLTNPKE